jgi:hypothetical protein
MRISLIKTDFGSKELITLVTSIFHPILFCNSEKWYTLSFNPTLEICSLSYRRFMSFHTLHKINNVALHEQMMVFKQALMLFKTCQFHTNPRVDWTSILPNFNILTHTVRSTLPSYMPLAKVFWPIVYQSVTKKAPNRLNLSFNSFKVKCKESFLSWSFSTHQSNIMFIFNIRWSCQVTTSLPLTWTLNNYSSFISNEAGDVYGIQCFDLF